MSPRPTPADPSRPSSEPLSPVDLAWLRMDEPTNLMIINGVLLFDEPLDPVRLLATIERRMASIPRFRQRVVFPPGGGRPRWEHVEDLRVTDHVVRRQLPPGASDRELQELVSSLAGLPLDYDRPLWILYLIEGFRGGSAILARLHHCIADGIALMLVLLSLTDTAPPPEESEVSQGPLSALFHHVPEAFEAAKEAAHRILPDSMRLMIHPSAATVRRSTRHVFRGLGAFGRLALRSADPKTVLKGPLSLEKRVAWSDPLPITAVKKVKEALGGTLNDVLTAVLAGGLRRYLEARGEPVDGLNFRAAVPVNLRRLDRMAELGNRFGLVFLSLPIGIADPVARLSEMRRRMSRLKGSAESVVVYGILGLLGRIPLTLQRQVVRLFGAKATAVMTNVPGPREVLYLAGRQITGLMFWVPQSGRLGMGVSIMSYAGEVRVGVTTDARLVPDPERVVEGFAEEFRHLYGLAERAAESA